jgi:hypothetical protein
LPEPRGRDAELAVGLRQVQFHRPLGDEELAADLAVRPARRRQFRDPALAGGQRLQAVDDAASQPASRLAQVRLDVGLQTRPSV